MIYILQLPDPPEHSIIDVGMFANFEAVVIKLFKGKGYWWVLKVKRLNEAKYPRVEDIRESISSLSYLFAQKKYLP